MLHPPLIALVPLSPDFTQDEIPALDGPGFFDEHPSRERADGSTQASRTARLDLSTAPAILTRRMLDASRVT